MEIRLHVFIHRRYRNMNGYVTTTPVYSISNTEQLMEDDVDTLWGLMLAVAAHVSEYRTRFHLIVGWVPMFLTDTMLSSAGLR